MNKHYIYYEDNHKLQLQGRFWNCGEHQTSIMASITKGVDWSAYIGADSLYTEQDSMKHALDYGCKLSESDARHFFSDIELPYRH